MNALEIIAQKSAVAKILSIGMTAHSGIVGDKDDLFILEPIDQDLDFKQKTRILYELAKVTGKSFVSWQPVQVYLNFNLTGKIMVFQEHFDPRLWDGDVIRCTPNDKLIEYVKNACK